MAEYSCQFTLVNDWPDVVFNDGSGDEYLLDPNQCQGLDSPGLRVPVDDKPQTHGGIVFPGKKKARHIIFAGVFKTTGGAATRNAMEDTLRIALESILSLDGTLSWTPTGGSARSLTVRYEIPLAVTGGNWKSFSFGLVAANPDW